MKKQKFIQKEMGKEKIVQNKMGFSLIELSIVILIVGALVLGVTKGSALMNKSRTTSAKTLTSSSPVLQISASDLVAWYEPTLDSSFNASQKFNTASLTTSNGGSWFDNSPTKSNPALAGATAPQYIESSINNLPSVRFTGSNTLTFNSLPLNQRDYTIFVVEQRRAAGSSTVGNFLDLGGNSFGYSADTSITMPSGAGSTTSATVAVYSAYVPRILTFLSSSNVASVTKGVFVNGGTGSVLANAVADNLMTATASGVIGKAGTTSFYNGDISEIIIYSKALKADERNDIQKYLSKKYGIAVAATNS